MKLNAYFLSGLGGDTRMFRDVQLPDHIKPVYIEWTTPFPDETISEYAERLFLSVADISIPFILVGISIGGMMVIEIAKLYEPKYIFIISSISSSDDMPRSYHLAKFFRLHHIIPVSLLKHLTIFKQQVTPQSRENKNLIREMVLDSNDVFIRWGLQAALSWRNSVIPFNMIHIHGRQDSVFPIRRTRPTHSIPGGHMVILDESKHINRILFEILKPSLQKVQ